MFRMYLIAAASQECTVICGTVGSVVVSVGGCSQREVMSRNVCPFPVQDPYCPRPLRQVLLTGPESYSTTFPPTVLHDSLPMNESVLAQ